MRKLAGLAIVMLAAIALSGCRVYSMINLDNTDFPGEVFPDDIPPAVLTKYTVGPVIVRPRIVFFDSEQTRYYLHVSFYAKETSPAIFVRDVAVQINGVPFEYGADMIGPVTPRWTTDVLIEPYSACSAEGGPVEHPLSEMTQATVDVSLLIAVRSDDGTETEKRITSRFVPKKFRIFE